MNILCVCSLGINRSKFCARWLHEKGYTTQFGGVDDKALNPLSQDMVLWADVIVIAHERHEKLLNEKFVLARKKPQFVLGVSDNRSMLSKEFAYLRDVPGDEFHEKWTYPQLERALEKLLPRLKNKS